MYIQRSWLKIQVFVTMLLPLTRLLTRRAGPRCTVYTKSLGILRTDIKDPHVEIPCQEVGFRVRYIPELICCPRLNVSTGENTTPGQKRTPRGTVCKKNSIHFAASRSNPILPHRSGVRRDVPCGDGSLRRISIPTSTQPLGTETLLRGPVPSQSFFFSPTIFHPFRKNFS
jgi:hypothetical protein